MTFLRCRNFDAQEPQGPTRKNERPALRRRPLLAAVLAGLMVFSFYGEKTSAAPVFSEAAGFQRDVAAFAARLIENLAASDAAAGLLDDGVVVCSFVELKKLNRTSSFGRYLAEQLINELQQRHYRVVEFRKTGDIYVQSGRGEFGLSREPAKIGGEAAAGALLTGTYTITPDDVMVNARIVDNRDNTVLASASTTMPRTMLVGHLLADSVTAKPRTEKEFIYMKSLER